MKAFSYPLRWFVPTALALACAQVVAADVDPGLHQRAAADNAVDVLIVMDAKAPKQLLSKDGDRSERRRNLVALLQSNAEISQAPVRAWLDAQGISYRPYWAVNSISARLTATQLDALAGVAGVARIASDAPTRAHLPVADLQLSQVVPNLPMVPEWGVSRIRAPEVWATGIRGQGVVIAGQDTGYAWQHESLKAKYRGWDGTTANHAYNWHDAVHSGGGSCGANAVAPCDDDSHGTHTMGTMVGDNGTGRQIGVAPDARWIGCRNMNVGNGTPATYIECTQWLMAPTDPAGLNPNPDLAPDIVNNSWGCVPSEGCTTGLEIREAIENIIDAGIFFVAAAGNDGSSCSTIADAPAMYDITFTVGGTNSSGNMYAGSSRGPVAGVTAPKPDVIAPAQSVPSAIPPNGYGNKTGTSMASPHVAGAAALLMSVNPGLKGDPARVSAILRQTAVPLTTTTQVCGDIPATTFPNNVQGAGQIDVFAAFRVAEKIMANGFDSN